MSQNKRLGFVIIALGIFTAISFGIFKQAVFAAPPSILSYQGRLANASGDLLGGSSGQTFYFRFSIHSDLTGGTQLWPAGTPAIVGLTVQNGVFNALIGDTSAGFDALTLDFDSDSSIFLRVEISTSDTFATSETLAPRQRIVSSGFAINADTVDGASAGTAANNVLKLGSSAEITVTGNMTTSADVAVNGGDLTTTATTFNLINATATTLNIGSAATTLNLADAAITGTLDIGGVTADGATTVNIATNATTADTITIGNTTAGTTTTLRGGSASVIDFADFDVAATGAVTIVPDSNVAALTLIGTNVTGGLLTLDSRGTTSGSIIDWAYGAPATQTSAIVGLRMDLSTNLTTANAQNVTNLELVAAGGTRTGAGTEVWSGIVIATDNANLTQNTAAGTINWRGLNIDVPAITQTTGTVTADGLRLTNSSITTGGTVSGLRHTMTAVGAGTLNGVLLTPPATTTAGGTINALNIGTITTSNGTDTAISVGAGWDTDLNATTSLEIGIGGTNELVLNATDLSPATSDGSALGTTALMWGDLFLASGGVINFDNGDVTLTHAANSLALAGGDFNVGIIDGQSVNVDGDGSPTADILVVGAGDTSATDGVDALQLTFTGSNASGNVIDITPSISVNASDTFNVMDVDAFTATISAAGTLTLNGLNVGTLTQSETTGTITATALNIGSGWDDAININSGTFIAETSGALAIDPNTTGTFLDFELATQWTSGTLINADFASATTQATSAITGLSLDLDTNLTGANGLGLTGINVIPNALTQTSTDTTTYTVYGNSASGALTQNTNAGTLNWRGLNLTLPVITQTTGTITVDGVRVLVPASGAIVTGGTMNGINVIAPTTSGPAAGTLRGVNIAALTSAGGATEEAITIGTGWDRYLAAGGALTADGATTITGDGMSMVGSIAIDANGENMVTIQHSGTISASADTAIMRIEYTGTSASSAASILQLETEDNSLDHLTLVNAAETVLFRIEGTGEATLQPGSNPTTAAFLIDANAVTSKPVLNLRSVNDSDSVILVHYNGDNTTTTAATNRMIELRATDAAETWQLNSDAGNTILTLIDFDVNGTLTLGDSTNEATEVATLTGISLDLSTNVTTNNDTITGVIVTVPTGGSGTTVGFDVAGSPDIGLRIASGAGDAINVNSGQFIVETTGVTSVGFDNTETLNGVCHSGADIDAATNATRDLVSCSAGPGDYAEWYETEPEVEFGDVVEITDRMVSFESTQADPFTGLIKEEKERKQVVVLGRASDPYSGKLFGVVSTSPIQTIGSDLKRQGSHPMPIALNGRTPVKIIDQNGAVAPGDYLTSSSAAGHAMKATRSGRVIGIALESWSGGNGRIMMLVQNFFWNGPDQLTVSQNPSGAISVVEHDLNMNGYGIVEVGRLAGISGVWNITADGHLQVRALTVGSPERPAGITLHDEVTGSPSCVSLRGGEVIVRSGACGTLVSSEASKSSEASEASAAEPTSVGDSSPPEAAHNDVGGETPALEPAPAPEITPTPEPASVAEPTSAPEPPAAPEPEPAEPNDGGDSSPPEAAQNDAGGGAPAPEPTPAAPEAAPESALESPPPALPSE